MYNDSENEKKIKETKKASEATVYDDFENEEMENTLEDSGMEEGLFSKGDLLTTPSLSSTIVSDIESEFEIKGEESVKNSCDIKTKDILKERWRLVTGRKPKNIPNLKILRSEEEAKEVILFGNRRPAEIEAERKLKWPQRIASIFEKKPPINYGIVHHEIRIQSTVTRGFMCVRFQKTGNYFATACRNGGVQVRNSHTGEVVWHVNTLEHNANLAVRGLRYHPHFPNRLYVGGGSGQVQVFNITNKENVGKSSNISTVNNLDVSSNGATLVTVGKEGKIVILDATTLQIISVKQRPNADAVDSGVDDKYHKSRIYGLKFHPHQINIFVTGGWDKTVKVWDVRTPTAIRNIKGPMISGDSVDIRGEMILTGSWSCEESLHLWHLPTGKLIQPISLKKVETQYDGEFLVVCQFFKLAVNEDPPNNNLVAIAGSGFNNVDIIRVSDSKMLIAGFVGETTSERRSESFQILMQLLATFPAYKPVSSMDTHANRIAYGGQESLLRIGEFCFSKNAKSLYF